jgi:hypothetical protein
MPIKQSTDGLKTVVLSKSRRNNRLQLAVRAKVNFSHRTNGGSYVADK